MKKRIFIWAAPALALTLVLAGCKKDEETVYTPSLSGLSIETVVPYVSAGTVVSVKADPDYIVSSDGTTPAAIGLSWQVNSEKKDTLTHNVRESNPAFEFTASELGTYTITCYAFAGSGYYTTSTSVTVNAIDPLTALSGMEGEPSTLIDGNPYRTINAGGLTWMAQNLYGTTSGQYYKDATVTESFLGKFYSWEEASAACPAGWRLPTAAEWDLALGTSAGDLMAEATLLEEEMWERWPAVSITNALLFNAIPTGYVQKNSSGSIHYGFKEYAFFWTSTLSPDPMGMTSDMAEYRYIYEDNPTVQKGKGSTSALLLSVRCVKED